ncbi:MAG: orotate phosphoribosyltransferase [Planctomycetota bacterium]
MVAIIGYGHFRYFTWWSNTMDRETLKNRLKEVAYIEGDFTLRSGRKSHYLIDKYEFETRPELLRALADELAAMIPDDADRLAGVELGGVPLVTAVALATEIPYVIVRKGEKGHGLDRPYEGHMEDGEHIALVEDITTTGGAAIRAARALLDAGASEVTALVVADRQEGASEAFEEAGITCRPLFTRESLDITPDS